MPHPKAAYSSRTLSGLQSMKMEMGGLCDGPGHEPRMVDVDTAVLISRYGPEAITEEVMQKISCSTCGQPVAMTISAISVRRAVPSPGI
jgi:hypothetical protein